MNKKHDADHSRKNVHFPLVDTEHIGGIITIGNDNILFIKAINKRKEM